MEFENAKFESYNIHSFRKIPQLSRLSESQCMAIETVGNVLPFKVNNYVIDQLIDWDNFEDDPMFILSFPQEEMLKPDHYELVSDMLRNKAPQEQFRYEVNNIRMTLNPHPAGQMEHNVPQLNDMRVAGVQHKYDETLLFFPSQSQTCHSYCTFCFRWPQFIGDKELKFASNEVDTLIAYLRTKPLITDVLFTGGDPLIMKTDILEYYIDALLNANLPQLTTIRIGTKALSYWPYRFTTDKDADALLRLFEKVRKAGKNLALMAHFNHPVELKTKELKLAIDRILTTGTQIRTQSPILNHINNDSRAWAEMWSEQVKLGCIPYYMFMARDTGAKEYFAVPIASALNTFTDAYQSVSGLSRTVRGPVMSCDPGKIHVVGTLELNGERFFVLTFLQERMKTMKGETFLARYSEEATWVNELQLGFSAEYFDEYNLKDQLKNSRQLITL
jgi:KamA family protein